MKSSTILFFLLLIFSTACTAQNKTDTNLDVQAFLVKYDASKDIVLDVRTPAEHNSGIFKGALLMNFYDKEFVDKLSILDKSQNYFVYCKSGGRSAKAVKKMKSLGFRSVYNIEGGIDQMKNQKIL